MITHPFDQAMDLVPDAQQRGRFTGTTSPNYWNMVGPFGGTTASVVLQAVLDHPDLLGAPVALTVNYAAAVAAGSFEVIATPVRTNRSTQHWTVQIAQPDAQGTLQVNTTATAITAARRKTWGAVDADMPAAPPASDVARVRPGPGRAAWLAHYDFRMIRGDIPAVWDGSGDQSETCLWLRDAPERALDFPSLASMADAFFPRVWLRRATMVAAGTVTITTYFHADAAQLAEVGTEHLLARAVGQGYRNGYFDQTAQLWSRRGQLLAASHQMVYFKE